MVTNYPPDQISYKFEGELVNEGWVKTLQNALLAVEDINLFVVYPQDKYQFTFEDKISDNFSAYGIYNSKTQDLESAIFDVLSSLNIDVVHIMGTEFPHSLHAYNACKKLKIDSRVVVSIQGLVSFCAKHYLFGVPTRYTLGVSLVELYSRFNSLRKLAHNFQKRGLYEEQLLKMCKHVIGRTLWDNKCAKLYNPSVEYHFNGENLRDEFYGGDSWDINSCEKNSIFISQATYPLKGLHHVLAVLPAIIQRYPNTKLYIAGQSPISSAKWKHSSYARYLSFLIKKGGIQNHVVFCGRLSASDMKSRYLNAHVFLSPSNIENSSNSIGEAMALGVPIVASNVGGTESIITNGVEGLTYPLNESYIMMQNILDVFSDDNLALTLSEKAKKRAQVQYNVKNNIKQLLEIYEEVGKGEYT